MAYNYTNPFASNPFIINPNANVGPAYFSRTSTDFGQPLNDFIFVLDENAARSYPVRHGEKVTLWDKNYPKFYIKSVDQNGIPSFRKFNFTEEVDEPAIESSKPVQTVTDEYVTKADMEKYVDKITDKLMQNIANLHPVNINTYRDNHKKPQNKEV